VIVVSVLLALSADAWWANRTDAQREVGHLNALERDFDQMASRLRASIETSVEGLEAANRLSEALETGPPFAVADSAHRMLFALSRFEVFSPARGAYDALIAAGDLELLSSEVLKQQLVEFFGGFDDLRVSEAELLRAQAHLVESRDFEELVGSYRVFRREVIPAAQADVLAWSRSPTIRNAVYNIGTRQGMVLRDYNFLSSLVDEIRETVTTELNGRSAS
jgi:hypothetical protein